MSQRINKWSTLLLEYNFDIQYIPGVNNTVADCMSRLPLQSLDEDFTDDEICIAEVSDITNGAISTQQFQAATQEDSTLQKAISYMHSQWPVRKYVVIFTYQGRIDLSDNSLCLHSNPDAQREPEV